MKEILPRPQLLSFFPDLLCYFFQICFSRSYLSIKYQYNMQLVLVLHVGVFFSGYPTFGVVQVQITFACSSCELSLDRKFDYKNSSDLPTFEVLSFIFPIIFQLFLTIFLPYCPITLFSLPHLSSFGAEYDRLPHIKLCHKRCKKHMGKGQFVSIRV